MKTFKLLLLICLATFAFPDSFYGRLPILEITIGENHPTGLYDKYADSGFSARLAYSRQFKNNEYFRGQYGFQYIHFDSDRTTTNFTLDNGVIGPSIDLTRTERALLLNAGIRFSMNDGIYDNGYFRPYIGGYLGFASFQDATRYDWSDNDCDDQNFFVFIVDLILDTEFSCIGDNDGNQSTTVHDKRTSAFYSVEMGANIHFPKTDNSGLGLDFGIRYNMIPGLERSETSYDDSNNEISVLSRKLEANYYTYYVGIFLLLDRYSGKSRKKKPKYTF